MAKEKFASRPQILKGDIVRVVGEGDNTENCHVVSDVRDTGVYSDYPNYHYNEEIAAVYRFDGRDFKCIWDREEVKLRREFLEMMHEAVEDFERNVKTAGADMPKRMREAFYKLHGVEEKN